MHIQYFVGPAQQRRTGGHIYHAELMGFMSRENEVIDEAGIAEAPQSNVFSANRWCWQRIKECKADVIVEDGYYAAYLFITNWLTKKWQPHIVVFVQAVPEIYTHWTLRHRFLHWFIMSSWLNSSSLIVANSYYTRQEILRRYPVRSSKVQVLSPAGQRFSNLQPRLPRQSDGITRLLSVANIQPKKGQKFLVEAMRQLRRPECHLALAGTIKDPVYYDDLLVLISRYGLKGQIHLPGFLEGEALAAAYGAADIFVHPCLGEGYGMVVAEAMGWGLPVVASRVGGIPEVIGNELNALLVPPGDSVALAEALRRLIEDPQLRAELAQRARKRADELPTWDEVGNRFCRMLLALS